MSSHIFEDIFKDVGGQVPPLLPIFRSRQQGELLAILLADPEAETTLTTLANQLDAPLSGVQREISRLEDAGILVSRRIGQARLVRANPSFPGFDALRELVELYFGVPATLAHEFAGIKHIDGLFIFGSWAARLQGTLGPPPADIDVLAVGSPDRDDLYSAALRAERRLGRPVNVTIRSTESWEAQSDGFTKQVRSGAIVPIKVDSA